MIIFADNNDDINENNDDVTGKNVRFNDIKDIHSYDIDDHHHDINDGIERERLYVSASRCVLVSVRQYFLHDYVLL